MMSRISALVSVMALMILVSPAAAEFRVTVAPKYWLASWDSDNFSVLTPELSQTTQQGGNFVFPSQRLTISDVDVSGGGLYGGTVDVSFWKMGISASFMTGDYDLRFREAFTSTTVSSNNDVGEHTSFLFATSEATRTDIDFTVRYNILPQFSVFLGYKFISYEYDDQPLRIASAFDLGGFQFTDTVGVTLPGVSADFNGPAIGFSGFSPLGGRFFSFGGASIIPYFIGDIDSEGDDFDDTGWGFNVDVGIGLNYPEAHLIPTISYRFQQFGGFEDVRDTFHGVALDLRAYFP